jgi:hypothetical protein
MLGHLQYFAKLGIQSVTNCEDVMQIAKDSDTRALINKNIVCHKSDRELF